MLGGIGILAEPHVGLHPSNPTNAYCNALLVNVSGMAEVGRAAVVLEYVAQV
jgi:hypothetical protein